MTPIVCTSSMMELVWLFNSKFTCTLSLHPIIDVPHQSSSWFHQWAGFHFGFLNRWGLTKLWNSWPPKGLVKTSAKFSVDLICLNTMIFAAIASLTLWQAHEWCFFFKTLDGTVVFNTTDWLSPCIIVGPSIGTPIILNWCLSAITISVVTLAATNSEPYVEVSTVFWRLKTQSIGCYSAVSGFQLQTFL